ncbi:MAG: alpha-L-arabinofuranosidase C-terminal domain-containing protein [Lachnospiraceae bacterium]
MKITRTYGEKISPEMIGLFFEDINFAADGGLYAEMIENRSFEAKEGFGTPGRFYAVDDYGYAWKPVYKKGEQAPRLQYVTGTPLSVENPHYLRLTANAAGQGVANQAYDGIYLEQGKKYNVSFYARCVAFDGEGFAIEIKKDGKVFAGGTVQAVKPVPYGPFTDLTVEFPLPEGPFAEILNEIKNTDETKCCREHEWIKYELVLTASETVSGADFVLSLDTAGVVEFDLISMIPEDAVAGIFRKDLFEALKEIKPGFIRFPGGCIVEGISLENRYQWKKTIGELKDRKYIPNLWAFQDDRSFRKDLDVKRPDAHYGQSYGIGFYEYFLLCELLGAKPLPVLGMGAACQFRTTEMVPVDSDEFKEFVQDALDLIEFANGPADSKWGGIRASMGHPEPFGLEMIAVGNEQWETKYVDIFARHVRFEKAIHEVYPEIRLLGTAGPSVENSLYDLAWEFYRNGQKANQNFVYAVDEHYYVSPEWLYDHIEFYDNYPGEVGVFAGEYAAHTEDRENTLESALAEAAFMTGLEKNAGVVRLASYAPLFNRIGHSQWKPDMIWFDDHQVYLTPNYYVQKLYGNHMGDHTLELDGQDTELRKAGIYVTVSETKEGELILKAVNTNDSVFELPLETENGQSMTGEAAIWVLEKTGQKPVDRPEPSGIAEMTLELKGSITLAPKSFTVVRVKSC